MMLASSASCRRSGICTIQRSLTVLRSSLKLLSTRETTATWLKASLTADRQGCESNEMFCFIHGLPTRNPGTWLPVEGHAAERLTCGNPACKALRLQWDMLRRREAMPWNERQQIECAVCQSERTRRSCLILHSTASEVSSLPPHKLEAFLDAPFVHPVRNPTNHAQRLRAIHFARGRESRILWTVALDNRVNSDGHRIGNQESWLTKMDRDTAGLPGLLPLILDLPIRFTQEPRPGDRLKGMFTNARGWLRGWDLLTQEEERVASSVQASGEALHRDEVSQPRTSISEWQTHIHPGGAMQKLVFRRTSATSRSEAFRFPDRS